MNNHDARILAIDDDPAVLQMVEQVLGPRFDCATANDLRVARQSLEQHGFDAVLCDVQMPGESGLALIEDLLTEYPEVAVIPIARVDDETVVERALELGVYGYLVKPFLPGQLLITTQTALRRRDAEAAERMRRRTLATHVQAAMDQAPLPIFVKDLERRYLLVSSFTHELLGLEAGEMIGRTDAELLPEAEPVIREGDFRVLHDEEPVYREETVELRGRQRTFLTVRFPYVDAKENLAGIVGVATEITALRKLEHSQRSALERLAQAAELHDTESGRDVHRTAEIAAYLAARLGWSEERITLLRAAAAMHDIGKLAVPQHVLRKPGPLNAKERAEMERHAEIGHRILADPDSELLQMAASIAHTHHEWYDGSGYPRGLVGEEIPLEGRIVAVADALDALLSDRPYRPAIKPNKAAAIIHQGRRVQFDPEVVDELLEHLEDAIELWI
jgi:PAS domain S-box-containing protein